VAQVDCTQSTWVATPQEVTKTAHIPCWKAAGWHAPIVKQAGN